MKVLTIVGARPQFIKAAAVSRALRKVRGIREVLVHTGQHYDENMSDVFFRELEIPRPDFDLGIGSGTHGRQTGRMMAAIETAIVKTRPDWVLVYGDTNSTLAGALAAAKLKVPLAHVEAGLRSFNRAMPEELNRIVADHVSDLLFAPTRTAVANLLREGIPARRIARVGDVMYDASLFYAAKAEKESRILDRLDLSPAGYVLATIHRAENTDDPARLQRIVNALRRLASQVPVVMPVHPRTRKALKALGAAKQRHPGLRLIPAVGYLDMVMLERKARLIVTDSGGVQKEAFFYRVPCITLRDETEWTELVEAGWNIVLSPGRTDLGRRLPSTAARFGHPRRTVRPYGRGNAAESLVARLLQHRRR
jgi:UDP-GlcNAc3NAcA epimerase